MTQKAITKSDKQQAAKKNGLLRMLCGQNNLTAGFCETMSGGQGCPKCPINWE